MDDTDVRTRINFFDFLRIFSGLLLLNAILSYVFTSSTTWGYEGKYVNASYLCHFVKGLPQQEFTLESLKDEVNSGRLLLSIDRNVFDVSANQQMYNIQYGSRYSIFIGCDCTRMFVNGCFNNFEQCTWDLRNIGIDGDIVNESVRRWVEFYRNHPKYWQVGYLNIGDINTYTLPQPCVSGLKYPV